MNPHLRASLLAEWRGLPEPPPQPDKLTEVSAVLRKVLDGLGLGERLEESQIQAAWQELVGEFIASHAAPVGLQDGCLTIRVSHPIVRYELETAWKKKILSHLRKAFPQARITKLRFQT